MLKTTLVAVAIVTGFAAGAMADAASDKKYCMDLAAQWAKYRAGAGSGAGYSVAETHMIQCDNPNAQIPQLKKQLTDYGHAVPDGTPPTLEQRVEALEKKVK